MENTFSDSHIARQRPAQDEPLTEVLLKGKNKNTAVTKTAESSSIWGPDAAQKYVSDHFDKQNPFDFKAPVADDGQAKKLTVFVNLAANRGLLNSSLREDEQLRQLQEMTRGKSASIIVQVAMNKDQDLNRTKATRADLIINALGVLPADNKNTRVVTYEISDGQKRLLQAGQSQGMEQNLRNLLTASPDAMKSEKLILISRTHGEARSGMRADAGELSIKDFKDVVSGSLAKSGRTKLDVLDFDACLMGNAQTLSDLSSLSSYIIASEEPEVAVARRDLNELDHGVTTEDKPGANAQPITEAVKKLLVEPGQSARESAYKIFATNGEECSKLSRDALCGANTLGLYDSSVAQIFEKSVDNLGQSLLDALSKDSNRTAIKLAIANSALIEGEPDGAGGVVLRRDLATFVQTVQKGIDDGSIKDNQSGQLRAALSGVNAAMSSFVIAKYNRFEPHLTEAFANLRLPTQPLDGVSIYLQDQVPPGKSEAFSRQMQLESLASQPNWNEFVKKIALD